MQRPQPLTARLERSFTHDPVGDARAGAHLEIESDASARERGAGDPGPRVRNAEIDRSPFIAAGNFGARNCWLTGEDHRRCGER